jgi:hypothetical protein
VRLAARFPDKSFATHPSRKERGKGWGTLIVSQAEKGWDSPPKSFTLTSVKARTTLLLGCLA